MATLGQIANQKSWMEYQNEYMTDRLGPMNEMVIYTDGFTEQTAFLSIIYATARWGFDKLFG